MYPDRSVPNKVHFREIKLFFCEFASKYTLFMDEIPRVKCPQFTCHLKKKH